MAKIYYLFANMTSISKKILRKIITSFQNNTINEETPWKCLKCFFEKYACRSCKVNYLKTNFTSWTSGNEIIDNFIQKKQLDYFYKVFEWIPYDQFNDIKIQRNQDLYYLAVWKDDPLLCNSRWNR